MGDQNGSGLGGNILRLRNIIDLEGESLVLRLSRGFDECISVYQTMWVASE